MVLINFYIAGPPKRLLILTTSGPSKRFITNSGSSRTISILQVIGHRTDIQTEKVKTGIQVRTAKAPGKSRPICKGKMKTVYNKLDKEHRLNPQSTISWIKNTGQTPSLQ